MSTRVTIQEIADALGLSRNTVSKAINNTGLLAGDTRQRILHKAREMGYRQFSYFPPEAAQVSPVKELALLTHSVLGNSHFAVGLLDAFQKKTSKKGCSLSMYTVRDEELASLTLPLSFHLESTVGILVVEIFDERYGQFLCRQGIPTLFVDIPAILDGRGLPSDVLMMENRNSAYTMTLGMLDAGARKLCFVGDHRHCQSFYERWCGFCDAAARRQTAASPVGHILDSDSASYGDPDWMEARIRALPEMPDAFFCANDYIAISVYRALRQMGCAVPGDVMLCGFDDAPEAKLMEPGLTTARIHGEAMGYIAADMLLSRVKYPGTPLRTSYIQTDVLMRKSTSPNRSPHG